jgi:predicted transcriptional regulator
MQGDSALSDQAVSNLLAFDRWLKDIDKTPATGWRWRKLGWIPTINIAGRVYVSREAIAEFEQSRRKYRGALGQWADHDRSGLL